MALKKELYVLLFKVRRVAYDSVEIELQNLESHLL